VKEKAKYRRGVGDGEEPCGFHAGKERGQGRVKFDASLPPRLKPPLKSNELEMRLPLPGEQQEGVQILP